MQVYYTDMSVESKYENFMNFNFNVTGNVRINQDLFNLAQNVSITLSNILNTASSEVATAQQSVLNAQNDVNAKAASVCANINDTCKKKLCSNILCQWTSWIIDQSCSLACTAAQKVLSLARSTLEKTQTVLSATQKTFGTLAKAADYVKNNVVTVFNIVNAGFNMNLNATNKDGYKEGISVNANMVILGESYNSNLNLFLVILLLFRML